ARFEFGTLGPALTLTIDYYNAEGQGTLTRLGMADPDVHDAAAINRSMAQAGRMRTPTIRLPINKSMTHAGRPARNERRETDAPHRNKSMTQAGRPAPPRGSSGTNRSPAPKKGSGERKRGRR